MRGFILRFLLMVVVGGAITHLLVSRSLCCALNGAHLCRHRFPGVLFFSFSNSCLDWNMRLDWNMFVSWIMFVS